MESIIVYIINTFTFTKLKTLLSIIFSYAVIAIWWYDKMVEAMYVLLFMDFALWFIYAWINNKLSKKKMQLWLVKLMTYSLALIVFNYAQTVTMWANIMGVWIREFWIWYLAINEALSCLKHLWDLWVPIPTWLIAKLENYRDNLEMKDLSDKK